MDTLKDDLERAVPRIDPGRDGVDELVAAGRRAVRRRRGAAVGLLAGGGLVAASLAVAVGTPEPPREARDPSVATQPAAPRSSAPQAPTFRVRLSLDTVLQVHGKCGPKSSPERVDEARGDGWSAVEFACGQATVRVLRTGGGGLVERLEPGAQSTLAQWGEARVGGSR